MAHNEAAGRGWSGRKIGAVLGIGAAGLMVLLPLATNAFPGITAGTPDSGVYSAFTPPPTMTEGDTETTTVAPTALATAKAAPEVKAPHR
jgi:hypothetical protein